MKWASIVISIISLTLSIITLYYNIFYINTEMDVYGYFCTTPRKGKIRLLQNNIG